MDVPLLPVKEGWLVVTVCIVSLISASGADPLSCSQPGRLCSQVQTAQPRKRANLGDRMILLYCEKSRTPQLRCLVLVVYQVLVYKTC